MTMEELRFIVEKKISLGKTLSEQLGITLTVTTPLKLVQKKGRPIPLAALVAEENAWVFLEMRVEHRDGLGIGPISNFDIIPFERLPFLKEEDVVKGVFSLLSRTLQHELRENFYHHFHRVYDPHTEEGLTQEVKNRDDAMQIYDPTRSRPSSVGTEERGHASPSPHEAARFTKPEPLAVLEPEHSRSLLDPSNAGLGSRIHRSRPSLRSACQALFSTFRKCLKFLVI